MKLLGSVCVVLGAVFVLFLAFFFFVYVPVSMYAQKKCLDMGFPYYEVTVTLDVYCVGYDGAVYPRVYRK